MSDQAVTSANGDVAAPLLDLREVSHWYGSFHALKGITCQLLKILLDRKGFVRIGLW